MTGMHVPVLSKQVIELLNPQSHQHSIDCTVGGGGHASSLLEHTGPDGHLLGIDLDDGALHTAGKLLQGYKDRVTLVRGNFSAIKQIYNERFSDYKVSIILLDLGLSSLELENSERGFSFQVDEPLDMRFDDRQELTAAIIVNTWPFEKIKQVIREYGGESLSYEITIQITKARTQGLITKTKSLVEAILPAFRNKLRTKRDVPWIGGIHPATRTFQALRIAVNDEIGNLERVLPQAIDLLESGGRVGIISFHSLEDRIVKNYFRNEARDCVCPSELPECRCDHRARVKIITKKPIVPSENDVAENRRSRSAKLRVAQKL